MPARRESGEIVMRAIAIMSDPQQNRPVTSGEVMHSGPAGLAGLLDVASAALACAVAPDSPLVARMNGLRDRLLAGRLQLAVLGQFKRGKSSVLNALLGVLPTGVVPLTAVATVISWGAAPLVRVVYKGQKPPEEYSVADAEAIRACLFRFVTEEVNPNNKLDISRVELVSPAPILGAGTVLIDHRHKDACQHGPA
jgi:hypothetical protein